MMQLPNTADSVACYAWMRYYFSLIGDCEPNTDGEVHLEPCNVQDIYEEYANDQRIHGKREFLGVSQFIKMWKNCFP